VPPLTSNEAQVMFECQTPQGQKKIFAFIITVPGSSFRESAMFTTRFDRDFRKPYVIILRRKI
jgi:hypothetical protein